jgi:deoxyribose-phosphate aldolase
VANFGWIRSGMFNKVTEDIKACADMAHQYGKKLKVIFETDALNEDQVRKSCQCAVKAGADFVKTSTGFLTGFEAHGAVPEIVKVMMEEVDGKCQVKGSGCIRTREHFLQLIDMGIDRMGVGYKSVPVVLNMN